MGNNIESEKAALNCDRGAWGLEAKAAASTRLQGAVGVMDLSCMNPEWANNDFNNSSLASMNRSKNVFAAEVADRARPYHPANSRP
jgi:hypothetical protein